MTDPWSNDPDRTTRKETPVNIAGKQAIQTEDGEVVLEGDRVYNYYDMWPGIIVAGSVRNEHRGEGQTNPRIDLWFDVQRDGDDERDKAMLNGARICTIAYAIRRGFKGV